MNTAFPALDAALPPHPGKTKNRESFPVVLRWLAGRERKVILAFYRFVRAADDWADLPDPRLEVEDRRLALARLAAAARQDLAATPMALAAFEAMLPAFIADARGDLPTDAASAFTACRASSLPVGRFLLALYGESPLLIPAADALCLALQLLNHFEDSPADRERWGRAYLPVEALPEMKAAVPGLLAEAACLPQLVHAPKLRRQTAATLVAARRQWQAFQDGRNFGLQDRLICFWAGFFLPCRPVGSPSLGSFRLALPLLPPRARATVKAIYGMARAWDALADENADLSALSRWRDRLTALAQGRTPADLPTDFLALLTRHRLPLGPFRALLDGLISDLAPLPRTLGRDQLFLYCDRVAGSVGELILAALGLADPDLARAAGRALQLTNILRDLDQDAQAGRIYLSRAELWVILPEIEALYAESFTRLAARTFRGRYAVRVMITLYQRLFLRLRANDAAPGTRLTPGDRLMALLGRRGR